MFKKARAAVRILHGESIRSVRDSLIADQFFVSKTVHHGFPRQPSVLALDPVQQLLAVGSQTGGIRFYGRAGIEHYVEHPARVGVMFLSFLVNEGALISVTMDNTLHLWNLRQKIPAVVQSLNFAEKGKSGGKITCCHVPLQSSWLYVGTDGGNVFTVSIDSFTVSFYTIYWNHVDSSSRVRPGSVQFLAENPEDHNKMLIVYEHMLALWDLRAKVVLFRQKCEQVPTSVAWLGDGKLFAMACQDGSIKTFDGKDGSVRSVVVAPPAKSADIPIPACHLRWLTTREEPMFIYSGGSAAEVASKSVTIRRGGDTVKALNFASDIVGLACLTSSVYSNEIQDPHALIVLLEDGLEVFDLTSANILPFPLPFATSLHQSPVTCIRYEADVPPDLLENLLAVGRQQRPVTHFSRRLWPLAGGTPSQFMTDFCDLIITGHVDGSLRFWDASQVILTSLYVLQTSEYFEKAESRPSSPASPHVTRKQQSSASHGSSHHEEELSPLAITDVYFCGESMSVTASNASGVVLLCKFSMKDKDMAVQGLRVSSSTTDLVVRRSNSSNQVMLSEEKDVAAAAAAGGGRLRFQHSVSTPSGESLNGELDLPWLQCRRGKIHQLKGFQAVLCLSCSTPGEEAAVQAAQYCESFGLLAVATSRAMVLVDVVQQKLLISKPLELVAEYIGQALNERKRSQTVSAGSPITSARKMPRLPTVRRGSKPPAETAAGGGGSGGGLSAPSKKRGLGFSTRRRPSTPSEDQDQADGGGAGAAAAAEEDTPGPTPQVPEGKLPRPRGFLAELKRKTSGLPSPTEMFEQGAVEAEEGEDEALAQNEVENVDHEIAICMQFAITYAKKDEYQLHPSLWVGSSSGNVIGVSMTLPLSQSRSFQEVSWESRAVVLRVSSKSPVSTVAILNEDGCLPQMSTTPYNESRNKLVTPSTGETRKKSHKSSTADFPTDSCHFLVAATDTTVYAYALPSHARDKLPIREGTSALRSAVTSLGEGTVFCSLTLDGHMVLISVPGLKPLMDIELTSQSPSSRMVSTQCWASEGQGLYMTSPSEIQRFSLLKENVLNLPDSLPDLFVVRSFPERVAKGFFASFMSGNKKLDREALFGSNMGDDRKGNQVVATRVNTLGGLEAVQLKTGEAVNVFERARDAVIERGEKLAQVEKKTAEMAASASDFAQTARALARRYNS